ncbi:Phosphate-repressible phosphate permease pho-4 [Alternaria arborescens]|uniref:Phosphate-repressible phosphate permease pho-4 n=1 Tax=Alternaria arborescens TaxID=156630 RepID=UPI0010751751|nr:Phosphate-repressible phosphate permease pho-4 [Alternaria arborescens]RYO21088.1 Phosphate-repressible phosphate permease pho-4 [Alternaria arborescens]
MAPPATAKYDWILAIATIAFVFASFGNGANDVANSYATSVAARTLTMAQAGIISVVTEFVGAVALGARVTSTIKNGIMSIDKFTDRPAALMLVMSCAEVGNASWLMLATRLGFPVSTTHTAVGSLIGAGIAAQSPIKWAWKSGSVSQIAASWLISPLLSGAFGAIVFATVKYSVLERKDPLKWAMRLIPIYLALTGAILALFIVIEAPTAPSLEEFGAGKAIGIIFGVFGACLLIAYVFFMPYFERRILKKDTQVKAYHIPLGPLLRKEGPPLYWPSKGDSYVDNYYADTYRAAHTNKMDEGPKKEGHTPTELDPSKTADVESPSVTHVPRKPMPEPYERFVGPVQHLSWANPTKWWGWFKFITLQGVTRDVLSHDSSLLHAVHSSAKVYDIRVEHLWTYCQVISAMMMSIAHGSNDVANAVGPWAAVYETYRAGVVSTSNPTPVWFLAIAGVLLGLGFWIYGYHIVRSLGNRITRMSPTRGFAVEIGAAITVLIASRLGLPVSTTHSLVGSTIGVALMNYDLAAVNWRQLLWIFGGWVLTLPVAGGISGLLCLLALNTPHL